MIEIEVRRNAEQLLKLYEAQYEKRYFIPAHVPYEEKGILDWLVQNFTMDEARNIIRHYLAMSGNKDWFVEKGHSLRTLKDNVGTVRANFGLKYGKRKYGILSLRPWTPCPRCKKEFQFETKSDCIAKDWGRTVCKSCTDAESVF